MILNNLKNFACIFISINFLFACGEQEGGVVTYDYSSNTLKPTLQFNNRSPYVASNLGELNINNIKYQGIEFHTPKYTEKKVVIFAKSNISENKKTNLTQLLLLVVSSKAIKHFDLKVIIPFNKNKKKNYFFKRRFSKPGIWECYLEYQNGSAKLKFVKCSDFYFKNLKNKYY